jgi:3-oxoacyl-(acyl-carrier-protein) synthase
MTDALSLLKDGEMKTVLAGGIDEITDTSHTILKRFGLYKKEPFPAGNIFQTGSKGTIAGEGASFFALRSVASGNDYAQLTGMDTFYKPASGEEIGRNISAFLERQNIKKTDIDLVISGENGDMKNDAVYDMVYQTVLSGITHIPFKHLSGEYPTASAFALWLAANILKTRKLPGDIQANEAPSTVLIYNHYQHIYHSLYLLTAC